MNNDEVVYLYYALVIKIMVEFIRTTTFSKYPANIHSVSLGTFVECISENYHIVNPGKCKKGTFN